METGSDFVGDLDELHQESREPEFPIPYTVKVAVDGPVQVHQVPSVSSGSRSWLLDTAGKRIVGKDPRRRTASLMSIDQNFYYGTSQQEVDSTTAALWPKLVPLVVSHQEEIWVRSATTTTTLSLVNEQWAD